MFCVECCLLLFDAVERLACRSGGVGDLSGSGRDGQRRTDGGPGVFQRLAAFEDEGASGVRGEVRGEDIACLLRVAEADDGAASSAGAAASASSVDMRGPSPRGSRAHYLRVTSAGESHKEER